MKKISLSLIMLAVLLSAPALACSKTNELTTGGACSIKELNNLEKTGAVQSKLTTKPKGELNLRPLKIESEMQKPQNSVCLFGDCIYKTLLGK